MSLISYEQYLEEARTGDVIKAKKAKKLITSYGWHPTDTTHKFVNPNLQHNVTHRTRSFEGGDNIDDLLNQLKQMDVSADTIKKKGKVILTVIL